MGVEQWFPGLKIESPLRLLMSVKSKLLYIKQLDSGGWSRAGIIMAGWAVPQKDDTMKCERIALKGVEEVIHVFGV